jgi:hypothetical protein
MPSIFSVYQKPGLSWNKWAIFVSEGTPELHPRAWPKERAALSYHGIIGEFNPCHNYPIYLAFALTRSYHGINGQNTLAFVRWVSTPKPSWKNRANRDVP